MSPTPAALAQPSPVTDLTLTGIPLEHLMVEASASLVFERCDFADADLGGLQLVDAKLFRGATISLNQAAALLGELGNFVA